MKFEVVKVANGYMVRPTENYRVGELYCVTDIYVFSSWAKASSFLRLQMEPKA